MRFTLLSGSIPRATGLKRIEAATGAVTLIQRFGSAANLNIHLHYLCFGWDLPPKRP
jgi:Putative transposase